MCDNLTASDIKKMQGEIGYRKLVVRKETLETMKETRAHGDSSENFEYKVTGQDKNRSENRICCLEKMTETARAISDNSRKREVSLGDTVEAYIPDDDETERYRLVTIVRGNSSQKLISIDSPLGKAIRDRKAGGKVYVKMNDRLGYDVEIRSVNKTTEEEKDKLRSR